MKYSLLVQHTGEENALLKPWLAPGQHCNLRLNQRIGCRWVQAKCAIYSWAFSFSLCKIKKKSLLGAVKLACCLKYLSSEKEAGEHKSTLPLCSLLALILSAVCGPDLTSLTRVLVFQSSVSHFNNFPATGQREQHGHKSKVSWTGAHLHQAGSGDVLLAALKCKRGEGCVYMMTLCLSIKSRVERGSICRLGLGMTEHLAEPGWHTNLTAASHQWWRAKLRYIFLHCAALHSFTFSAFCHHLICAG